MGAEILGIHGIGQQRQSPKALQESWKVAARQGIIASNGSARLRSMEVAYYAMLFRKGNGRLGHQEDAIDVDTPLSVGEQRFLDEILEDNLISDTDVRNVQAQTLGLIAVPSSVARFLVATDRKFGRGAGKRLLYFLRQVYRYLTDEDLSSAIRQKVAESASTVTNVILGHSLGSVVLYDMLLRGDFAVKGGDSKGLTIVTFGSPLAWPTVRRMLGHGSHIQDVGCDWRNVFDPKDAITGGMALNGPRTVNISVTNGLRDPHAAVNYLRQSSIGDLLL